MFFSFQLTINFFTLHVTCNHDQETQRKLRKCIKLTAIKYFRIVTDPTGGRITPAWENDRTIDSFDDSNCQKKLSIHQA